MHATLPKTIRENIARAKGYLLRGEVSRALETMSAALREGGATSMSRTARFEMEAHLVELLNDLPRHPPMRALLDPHNTGKPRPIPYQQGKEAILATVLEGLNKILLNAASQQEQQEQEAVEQRRKNLIEIGVEALQGGDFGRGRSFLRRAVAEFGDHPGMCMEVGRLLDEHKQYVDAAQVFEMAFEKNSKEVEAYGAAVQAYLNAMEYEKAEAVFLKILRQFGGHASTYGRMAKMYYAWHKRTKAEEFAVRALQLDKTQPEALEIMERIDRRGA